MLAENINRKFKIINVFIIFIHFFFAALNKKMGKDVKIDRNFGPDYL